MTAVVLTHMRPRLAGDVTRALLEVEGLPPDQVVVVVNDVGGLDDPGLESSVRMLRLPTNSGPAGGFRAGLLEAFSDPATSWAYLCEDDIGLFSLPGPAPGVHIGHVRALPPSSVPVGAVAAYGRRFVGHGGHTVNVVPPSGSPEDLVPIDVSCWGATLVSPRRRRRRGAPRPRVVLRVRGLRLLLPPTRRPPGSPCSSTPGPPPRWPTSRPRRVGRRCCAPGGPPTDEAWRAYYVARNYFALARRHGTWRWILWHLAYSARRLQLAHGREERLAILHGLWDGARGRLGTTARYRRRLGERPSPS